MAPLGLVLAGRYATGSYAVGAMLAGVYSVAESAAAPVLGRRLDRVERRGGMLRGLAGASIAFAALMVGVVGHAALPVLLAATTAAAVLPSAVQGGMRGYLPHLVGERSSLAFALDATLIEVEWLVAQAIVAVVALFGVPFVAVAAMLATTVAALPAMRLLPPLRVQPSPADPSGGSLEHRGLLVRVDSGWHVAVNRIPLGSRQIDVEALRGGRRPTLRACLDWSERRVHVASALGAALAAANVRALVDRAGPRRTSTEGRAAGSRGSAPRARHRASDAPPVSAVGGVLAPCRLPTASRRNGVPASAGCSWPDYAAVRRRCPLL
jgi:hypothetical protein